MTEYECQDYPLSLELMLSPPLSVSQSLIEQHAVAWLQCFKSLGLRPVVNSQRLCPKSRHCDWLLLARLEREPERGGTTLVASYERQMIVLWVKFWSACKAFCFVFTWVGWFGACWNWQQQKGIDSHTWTYMNLVNWNVSLQCLHLHKSLKCESWNPFGENVLNCFPFASNWVIGFVSDLIPNTNIAIRKEFTKQMHLAQIKVMFVTKQKGMFA